MDEETLLETVTTLVKAKRYEKALEAVGIFLAEHDQSDLANVSAFVEQGYIYYKMKRFRESLRAFDEAIELDDQSGPAWAGRTVGVAMSCGAIKSLTPPTAEREIWLRKTRVRSMVSESTS